MQGNFWCVPSAVIVHHALRLIERQLHFAHEKVDQHESGYDWMPRGKGLKTPAKPSIALVEVVRLPSTWFGTVNRHVAHDGSDDDQCNPDSLEPRKAPVKALPSVTTTKAENEQHHADTIDDDVGFRFQGAVDRSA